MDPDEYKRYSYWVAFALVGGAFAQERFGTFRDLLGRLRAWLSNRPAFLIVATIFGIRVLTVAVNQFPPYASTMEGGAFLGILFGIYAIILFVAYWIIQGLSRIFRGPKRISER